MNQSSDGTISPARVRRAKECSARRSRSASFPSMTRGGGRRQGGRDEGRHLLTANGDPLVPSCDPVVHNPVPRGPPIENKERDRSLFTPLRTQPLLTGGLGQGFVPNPTPRATMEFVSDGSVPPQPFFTVHQRRTKRSGGAFREKNPQRQRRQKNAPLVGPFCIGHWQENSAQKVMFFPPPCPSTRSAQLLPAHLSMGTVPCRGRPRNGRRVRCLRRPTRIPSTDAGTSYV